MTGEDSLFPASAAEPELGPPLPVGLGRMMAGGGDKRARQANDFYPTPANVTRALLARERPAIASAAAGGPVWEPCARGGAILAELAAAGFAPTGTDIVADPANGVEQADLLAVRRARGQAVVTNPPFALAAPMIRHLWCDLKVQYLALLLKSSFWHAASRHGLWRAARPARILALGWRPDFLGGGSPPMDVIWCVWQRGWPLACSFDILGPARDAGLFAGDEG